MGKGGDSLQVEKSRQIGLEELSEHRTPEDAWMTYKGKVYDVSGWQDHPGEK
jgi:acyl-lipid Delta6-acetylenase / acyl-lipid (9-3)-desaturase